MKIKVTEKHISKGVSCDAGWCAVALAFQDATGNKEIVVGARTVLVPNRIIKENFDLPQEVVDFIGKFDMGYQNLLPFEFEIDLKK